MATKSQKPVSPVTGAKFQVENYFFQALPLSVKTTNQSAFAHGSFRFIVFKGTEKFAQTLEETAVKFENSILKFENYKLNFCVLSYNPEKNVQFALRIIFIDQNKKQKEIGEHIIVANNFINQYLNTENGAFNEEVSLSEDLVLTFELYVQKSRFGVERLVKNVKHPKPKKKDQLPTLISFQKVENKIQRKPLISPPKDQSTGREKFTRFSPRRQSAEDRYKNRVQVRKEQQEKQPDDNQLQNIPLKEISSSERTNNFIVKKKTIEEKPIIKEISSISQENTKKLSAKQSQKEGLNKAESKKTQTQSLESQDIFNKMERLLNWKVLAILIALFIISTYFIFFNQSSDENQLKRSSEKIGKKDKNGNKVKGEKSKIAKKDRK